MTTAHRITTAAVLLSLAAAGAPAASARPAYDPPTAANRTPTSVYSRQDKSMMPLRAGATDGGAIGRAAALRSLTQQKRQRVAGISALSDRQLAAAFSTAPPVAATAGASHAVVRIHATPAGGFDWGDAGIGAAGGLALAMLGVGGGLVISHQRPRRPRHTRTLPN